MLSKVHLKFGPQGTEGLPLAFEPAAMTVFVGPNNSGKSLVLRELHQYSESGPTSATRKIIDALEVALPNEDEVDELLESRRTTALPNETVPSGHICVSRPVPSQRSSGRQHVDLVGLKTHLAQIHRAVESRDVGWWRSCWAGIYTNLTSLFTVMLDGRTRLALTQRHEAQDLLAAPPNHLVSLFQNEIARGRVRKIVREAFGLHFVIDPTYSGHLRIRMSERAPNDDSEEQALDKRARDFHSQATDIDDLSDGVKAFVGLISALSSSDYRIMLVDEPEAFLHPPLAGQLGREAATLAAERDGNVFASTHSSRFLIGCVESGKRINIVRLTYKGGRATARLLPHTQVKELMQDPLLHSANVLDALFYSGAVVCEADRDRVFYQEINRRLLAEDREAVSDSLFLNAQNKQTVRRILGPLRSMGIPAAGVVDIDIVKGNDLKELLKECNAPPAVVQSIGQLRGNVESAFRNLDMSDGGIKLLQRERREECQNLLERLAEYGIFVVPDGGVESWLSYLDVEASKKNWLPQVFDVMRSDPAEDGYIRPENDDVWRFVKKIAGWVGDEQRRGMPSA